MYARLLELLHPPVLLRVVLLHHADRVGVPLAIGAVRRRVVGRSQDAVGLLSQQPLELGVGQLERRDSVRQRGALGHHMCGRAVGGVWGQSTTFFICFLGEHFLLARHSSRSLNSRLSRSSALILALSLRSFCLSSKFFKMQCVDAPARAQLRPALRAVRLDLAVEVQILVGLVGNGGEHIGSHRAPALK